MKLYYHPASTTCRPIMLLAAAEKIDLDYQLVDLFSGENYQPAFTSVNPNQAVPLLVDGDFQLAESSAILKYLAEKFQAPSLPDRPARTRPGERAHGLVQHRTLSRSRLRLDLPAGTRHLPQGR